MVLKSQVLLPNSFTDASGREVADLLLTPRPPAAAPGAWGVGSVEIGEN